MRIFIRPAGKGGVAYYRTIQPYTHISDKCDVFIADNDKYDMRRISQEAEIADVMVLQMPFGEMYYNEMMANKKRKKPKLMIAEFDDNIFDIHPLNNAYRNFGQDNVIKYFTNLQDGKAEQDKFKKYSQIDRELKIYKPEEQFNIGDKRIIGEIDMWRDGQDDFNLEDNRKRMEYTKATIQMADLVTVSTDYLGKVMRKLRTGPIAVLPNLIDIERWKPMKPNDTDEIRLGWSGGSAHYQDLFMIKGVMAELLDKYPKLKIVIKGAKFGGLFRVEHSDRVEWQGWHSDIYTYPLDIRDMKIDLAMCPVIDDRFNRAKSELKWMEFSAMKVPCVCSRTAYGGVVDYGKTGFVADHQKEWVDCLSRLIESNELREEIGQKAYNRVSTRHSVDHSEMWHDLIRDARFNMLKGITKAKTLL